MVRPSANSSHAVGPKKRKLVSNDTGLYVTLLAKARTAVNTKSSPQQNQVIAFALVDYWSLDIGHWSFPLTIPGPGGRRP